MGGNAICRIPFSSALFNAVNTVLACGLGPSSSTLTFTPLFHTGGLNCLSTPLLQAPPPVRLYAPGSWGPNAIHQLIAPHAWRLPFERSWRDSWRDPNPAGG